MSVRLGFRVLLFGPQQTLLFASLLFLIQLTIFFYQIYLNFFIDHTMF